MLILARPHQTRTCFTLLLMAFVIPARLLAAPMTPGNICISSGMTVFEYTTSGQLVQTLAVPTIGSDEPVRDIVIDDAGRLQCFTGTFAPALRTLDALGTGWASHSFPGWSCVNNTREGGIAAYRNFIFVSDDWTARDSDRGVVRFDSDLGYSAARFAAGTSIFDVTVGLDGLVYALEVSGSTVDVFLPTTMQPLPARTLSLGCSAIAVDANGTLYGVSYSDGALHRFDQAGRSTAALRLPYAQFACDLDLSSDGRFVISAGYPGGFMVTDLGLSPIVSHLIGHDDGFVAWVPTPFPTPTRTSTWGALKASYR